MTFNFLAINELINELHGRFVEMVSHLKMLIKKKQVKLKISIENKLNVDPNMNLTKSLKSSKIVGCNFLCQSIEIITLLTSLSGVFKETQFIFPI